MKATMRNDGVIVISAESGVEAFALKKWMELSEIRVDDAQRSLTVHVNPTYLIVDANNPELPK